MKYAIWFVAALAVFSFACSEEKDPMAFVEDIAAAAPDKRQGAAG